MKKNRIHRADYLNSIINDNKLSSPKKYGSSTTTGVLKGNAAGFQQDLWLKRFNNRGFFDFLLKRVFGSRAKRLWDINQKLFKKGLPVPMPVAFIKPSFSIRHSFFLSAIIKNSENLLHAYRKWVFDNNIAMQLAEAITKWHLAGAVHGDLKWSNILVQKEADLMNIFFVDLDQAKLYSSAKISGILLDLSRFYRYGLELGAEEWVQTEFFPAYLDMLPEQIKAKIDLVSIRNKAKKDWERKGRRHLQAKQ